MRPWTDLLEGLQHGETPRIGPYDLEVSVLQRESGDALVDLILLDLGVE